MSALTKKKSRLLHVKKERDAGSCPTRKLSDKTQPNDTRNYRTVSVSNTFLRPKRASKVAYVIFLPIPRFTEQ